MTITTYFCHKLFPYLWTWHIFILSYLRWGWRVRGSGPYRASQCLSSEQTQHIQHQDHKEHASAINVMLLTGCRKGEMSLLGFKGVFPFVLKNGRSLRREVIHSSLNFLIPLYLCELSQWFTLVGHGKETICPWLSVWSLFEGCS